MSIDREVRLHDAVESAVSKVYAQIWGDNGLTPAESRLAWLQVIDKMIQSAMADRQTEVTAEQMGLKREQAPLDPLRLKPASPRWHEKARVYPHGMADQAELGFVAYADQSVAVIRFDHVPAFCALRHPEYNQLPITMLLRRVLDPETKKGVGPWIEESGRGHYEVECIP